MFCYKCGAQVAEGAFFCGKCGTKIPRVDAAPEQTPPVSPPPASAPPVSAPPVSPPPVSAPPVSAPFAPVPPVSAPPGPPRMNDIPPAAPVKKKSKAPLIILVVVLALLLIAAAVVTAVVFAVRNWEGETDYEATVRAYTPYAKSQGMPYTCGEVFDRYIPDAEWNVRASDDMAYVDISGTAKGTDKKLSVTIRVEDEGDLARMEPVSIKLDGEKRPEDVFFVLFLAYDNKERDLSHIEEWIKEVDSALRGDGASGTPVAAEPGADPGAQELAAAKAAYADIVQSLAAENSSLTFELIDLTDSDIPELMAGLDGYYVSVYMWADGRAVPVIDGWPYGAGGNLGYEYLPGQSIIRNIDNDMAGAIVYETYMTIDANYQVVSVWDHSLSVWYFQDWNGNYMVDDNEPYLDEPIYYYGDAQITAEQYAGYQIPGDYLWMGGGKSAASMLELLGAAAPKGGLLFDGFPVSEWVGAPLDPIMSVLGTPVFFSEGGGVNYCEYDGILFEFDYERIIYAIDVDAGMCSWGGVPLNKRRSEIIEILGTPTSEDWGSRYNYDSATPYEDVYILSYSDRNFNVQMPSPDHLADKISLWGG